MTVVLSRELRAIANDLPSLSEAQLPDIAELLGELAHLADAMEMELRSHRLLERGRKAAAQAATPAAAQAAAALPDAENVIRPVFRRTDGEHA